MIHKEMYENIAKDFVDYLVNDYFDYSDEVIEEGVAFQESQFRYIVGIFRQIFNIRLPMVDEYDRPINRHEELPDHVLQKTVEEKLKEVVYGALTYGMFLPQSASDEDLLQMPYKDLLSREIRDQGFETSRKMTENRLDAPIQPAYEEDDLVCTWMWRIGASLAAHLRRWVNYDIYRRNCWRYVKGFDEEELIGRPVCPVNDVTVMITPLKFHTDLQEVTVMSPETRSLQAVSIPYDSFNMTHIVSIKEDGRS